MDDPTKSELQAERYKMALEAIKNVYEKGDKAYEISKDALHGQFAKTTRI